jgi:hypothetical protein
MSHLFSSLSSSVGKRRSRKRRRDGTEGSPRKVAIEDKTTPVQTEDQEKPTAGEYYCATQEKQPANAQMNSKGKFFFVSKITVLGRKPSYNQGRPPRPGDMPTVRGQPHPRRPGPKQQKGQRFPNLTWRRPTMNRDSNEQPD